MSGLYRLLEKFALFGSYFELSENPSTYHYGLAILYCIQYILYLQRGWLIPIHSQLGFLVLLPSYWCGGVCLLVFAYPKGMVYLARLFTLSMQEQEQRFCAYPQISHRETKTALQRLSGLEMLAGNPLAWNYKVQPQRLSEFVGDGGIQLPHPPLGISTEKLGSPADHLQSQSEISQSRIRHQHAVSFKLGAHTTAGRSVWRQVC